jgi:hypothetical protein
MRMIHRERQLLVQLTSPSAALIQQFHMVGFLRGIAQIRKTRVDSFSSHLRRNPSPSASRDRYHGNVRPWAFRSRHCGGAVRWRRAVATRSCAVEGLHEDTKGKDGKCALYVDVPLSEAAIAQHLVENFQLPEPLKNEVAKLTKLAQLSTYLTEPACAKTKNSRPRRRLRINSPISVCTFMPVA